MQSQAAGISRGLLCSFLTSNFILGELLVLLSDPCGFNGDRSSPTSEVWCMKCSTASVASPHPLWPFWKMLWPTVFPSMFISFRWRQVFWLSLVLEGQDLLLKVKPTQILTVTMAGTHTPVFSFLAIPLNQKLMWRQTLCPDVSTAFPVTTAWTTAALWKRCLLKRELHSKPRSLRPGEAAPAPAQRPPLNRARSQRACAQSTSQEGLPMAGVQ